MHRDMYVEWFELETYHWWFVGRRRLFVQLIEQILQSEFLSTSLPPLGCRHGMRYGG